MSRNSFKDLENENRERFSEKEDKLKSKINGSYSLLKLMGSMFEVFVPGLIRMFGGFARDKSHTSDGAPAPSKPNDDDQPSYYPDQSKD